MPTDTSQPPRPSREPSFAMSAQQLGVYILLASLSVLFTASIVGYLITRSESEIWRPPGMPGLPAGLWLSSVLALGISVALETARRAVQKNQPRALRQRLWTSALLALGFLGAQIQNWRVMHAAIAHLETRTLFPYTFYMLTGLHAAHVVGGLVPLGLVLYRAEKREYSSSRHEGLRLCIQYWHFLSGVWAVLFVLLELGSA
jgi:cytochrome c oxidase subunit 3